jgi:hypothetical protein
MKNGFLLLGDAMVRERPTRSKDPNFYQTKNDFR